MGVYYIFMYYIIYIYIDRKCHLAYGGYGVAPEERRERRKLGLQMSPEKGRKQVYI